MPVPWESNESIRKRIAQLAPHEFLYLAPPLNIGLVAMNEKVRSIWFVVDQALRVWYWERGAFETVIQADTQPTDKELVALVDIIRRNCKPKPGMHYMVYTMRSNPDGYPQYIPGATPVKRIVWTEPKVDFEFHEYYEDWPVVE